MKNSNGRARPVLILVVATSWRTAGDFWSNPTDEVYQSSLLEEKRSAIRTEHNARDFDPSALSQ